ncbi:hypothetical protein D0863_00339 [Hortaea werneckii]|uniref:J domain-containing protein n=1 Tax=Hortaea werneckii TaxID=91943 RepID=A0A3M7ER19_HORWE|nr:hypothetical protein D0863_00339 [Hortaea werneckii]
MSNHYERLGLASRPRDGTLSAEAIKQAYRQALLSHHPDKLRDRQKKDANRPALSVDQITFAYKVLSDPELRAEYDFALLHEASNDREHGRVHQTGLETVDLDALDFQDESEGDSFARRICASLPQDAPALMALKCDRRSAKYNGAPPAHMHTAIQYHFEPGLGIKSD